ncbi:immunity 53 family protein [Luteolibacter sp. GHJ8]|uniref:Immunity 53 family protein n=1 Tax=Luteolibacter rhizosphaerae TaxID=2989719 RepID=A0ABT3G773_9BACT|nr:immunity 53 family protein [Luteolibacter rhizosphaerae]MCW1915703.1 immunity 53 family protein [Luteolibacter rhizosphaerae]
MHRRPPETNWLVDFSKLVGWYKSHCDRVREHEKGIRLETLDNPGWILKINLVGTNLEGCAMAEVAEGLDDGDHLPWIHCYIRENEFVGACDPDQVARLFAVFEDFRTASLS